MSEDQVEFDWDEANERHLDRHGVTAGEFEQAMLIDPEYLDVDEESGEERIYAMGPTKKSRFLFLVFTHRGSRVRPITAWDAPQALVERWLKSRGLT